MCGVCTRLAWLRRNRRGAASCTAQPSGAADCSVRWIYSGRVQPTDYRAKKIAVQVCETIIRLFANSRIVSAGKRKRGEGRLRVDESGAVGRAVGPAGSMDRMRFPWRVEVQRSAGPWKTGWRRLSAGGGLVLGEPIIGVGDAFAEGNFRAPAEGFYLRDVEEFAGCAVGFACVEFE